MGNRFEDNGEEISSGSPGQSAPGCRSEAHSDSGASRPRAAIAFVVLLSDPDDRAALARLLEDLTLDDAREHVLFAAPQVAGSAYFGADGHVDDGATPVGIEEAASRVYLLEHDPDLASRLESRPPDEGATYYIGISDESDSAAYPDWERVKPFIVGGPLDFVAAVMRDFSHADPSGLIVFSEDEALRMGRLVSDFPLDLDTEPEWLTPEQAPSWEIPSGPITKLPPRDTLPRSVERRLVKELGSEWQLWETVQTSLRLGPFRGIVVTARDVLIVRAGLLSYIPTVAALHRYDLGSIRIAALRPSWWSARLYLDGSRVGDIGGLSIRDPTLVYVPRHRLERCRSLVRVIEGLQRKPAPQRDTAEPPKDPDLLERMYTVLYDNLARQVEQNDSMDRTALAGMAAFPLLLGLAVNNVQHVRHGTVAHAAFSAGLVIVILGLIAAILTIFSERVFRHLSVGSTSGYSEQAARTTESNLLMSCRTLETGTSLNSLTFLFKRRRLRQEFTALVVGAALVVAAFL